MKRTKPLQWRWPACACAVGEVSPWCTSVQVCLSNTHCRVDSDSHLFLCAALTNSFPCAQPTAPALQTHVLQTPLPRSHWACWPAFMDKQAFLCALFPYQLHERRKRVQVSSSLLSSLGRSDMTQSVYMVLTTFEQAWYKHRLFKNDFWFYRKEKNPVQLDDEGGRTFLRVLIHLIMHDDPPLLSGALQLLFKHFSQRAEVLQAFKQVRLSTLGGSRAEALEVLMITSSPTSGLHC